MVRMQFKEFKALASSQDPCQLSAAKTTMYTLAGRRLGSVEPNTRAIAFLDPGKDLRSDLRVFKGI